MKRVAEALGVSRSNLAERTQSEAAARGPYVKAADEALLPLIRRFVDERPTYGYRRIAALVNRERATQGMPPANRKRVHRIMQRNAMLLQRHTGRREGRLHNGKVMVMCSNLRWCSDGLEFTCWNGDVVRMAFIIDALMMILVVLRFGTAMAVIDEYLIFGGFNRDSPTYTWTMFMYDQAFKLGLWRQGFAAAIGMVGAIAMMFVMVILIRIFRSRD